ncbi:toll/interleukin-1 receptor domain-containing protein, partial [Frankia sp. CiP3]
MSDRGAASSVRWDFLLSYAAEDRPWAEWLAWQLEAAGYRVLIEAWDLVPGSNRSAHVQRGALEAERTIAILSAAYLNSCYEQPEWQAA